MKHVPDGEVSLSGQMATLSFHNLSLRFWAACNWINGRYTKQKPIRRLKILETLSIGEKRFVSIMQVDEVEYLIASNTGNISLIAVLSPEGRCTEVSKVRSRRKLK